MTTKYIRYIKNLSTYFGASLIPMILNLISNPWIAQNMAPKDYAISGYYTSFSSLISPIIIFYLIHYYIKEYYRRNEDERIQLYALTAKATIWFSGIISIICFIGLYIYLNYFNQALSLPIMPYLAFMVFALPLTGLLNLQLAQYRMEKKAIAYFRLSTANGILNVALSLLFVVWLKWGAFGKLLAPLVCNSVIFIIMLYTFRNYFKVRTTFKEFRIIFIFCLPLALSAMLGYFTSGYTTTYLESLGQTTEYGIYVVGVSIGAYLTVFSTAVNNTFQPDIYETIIKKEHIRCLKLCALQICIIAMIVGMFIYSAPKIISLLTSGRYEAATPYAQIASIAALTSAIYFLINNYTIVTNRPKIYLYTTILGSIGIITILPFAVDEWLFTGGVWVNSLSFLLFSLINIFLIFILKRRNENSHSHNSLQ